MGNMNDQEIKEKYIETRNEYYHWRAKWLNTDTAKKRERIQLFIVFFLLAVFVFTIMNLIIIAN
jgi:hypothetical protein